MFSVYGGAKLVLIAMTPIIMLYAVAFSYLWPAISQGLIALTGFMKSSGSLGVFVYGFFEKFLIPTGLHHFIWSPFQLTSIGGSIVQDGQTVSGSQAIFLAYMRDPSISPLMNEALRFSQQGMVTIFGLSGAALAFYHTAKPEKKMLAKAILIPAITTSILVGITEPIEFTFLFISPLLWVIHAVLTALSQVACNLFQVRPGRQRAGRVPGLQPAAAGLPHPLAAVCGHRPGAVCGVLPGVQNAGAEAQSEDAGPRR